MYKAGLKSIGWAERGESAEVHSDLDRGIRAMRLQKPRSNRRHPRIRQRSKKDGIDGPSLEESDPPSAQRRCRATECGSSQTRTHFKVVGPGRKTECASIHHRYIFWAGANGQLQVAEVDVFLSRSPEACHGERHQPRCL